MTGECCEQEVRHLLREEGILELPEQADAETDLFAHGLDSLAVMQLIVAIEERWGIALGMGAISRDALRTPARLAATINAQP